MSVDSATKSFSKMELQEANKHAHEAAEAATQTPTDSSHRNKDGKLCKNSSDLLPYIFTFINIFFCMFLFSWDLDSTGQ